MRTVRTECLDRVLLLGERHLRSVLGAYAKRPPERSDNLAVVVIAALEGAIVLARIRHDLTPFDALVLELGPLLDAAAPPAAPGLTA